MKNIALILSLFLAPLFCFNSFGQIDVELVDLKNNQTVALDDIYSVYDLDAEKPTVVITWSGKWCFPCISLIERYNLCDLDHINLVTINVDTEDNLDEVIREGYHSGWNTRLNFHANLGSDKKGLDNVFNVQSAPLILFIKDGNISDALVSYSIYPYTLLNAGRIDDVKFIWDSPEDLNSLAWYSYIYEDDVEELEIAKTYALRSMELDKGYNNTDTYAALLFKTGQYTKALKTAKEAMEIAIDNDQSYDTTTNLINEIIEKL